MARVLVIDDEAHVRAAVSIALKMKGFEVVAVESGRMGLSEQEKTSFDLVIVDVYMPNMDGIQFIKALRQRRPNLPIIVMSGVLYRGTGGSALDVLPMARHLIDIVSLQKPFRPKQLLQAVQNAMGIVAAQ
jgi:DNA-binding NtrC family response regulator